MTMQASGAISLSQVGTEITATANYASPVSMNNGYVRTLNGATTAQSAISMSNFYSKTYISKNGGFSLA